ncbi:site-specific integrase [Jatrophihabitans sp.]|uniref:tyrosine-type recombinase/integrase n=1 Tax=Jatrophihabitans sp. TaxID=1932789 RepID=UPI0030C711D1|nr:site-specific integrase [Jatrophihabitans sp.]
MPKVQQRESGNYFVRFRLNAVQTTLTFGTDPEAAAQFVRDVDQRGVQWAWDNYQASEEDAAEMTLGEWAARHFKALPHVGPATLENYQRDWRLRWQPHLGHMRLSRITREDVTTALAKQTGSDKTIANAWGTLASMFKMAVLDGHMERSPTTGVKLAKRTSHEKAEHRYLTADEFMQVLEDTSERYRPLVWMLGGTGMRWGEAAALTVADVNLAAKTVLVNKAWKRDREKGWYVGPPKTARSKRTITLPNEVVESIRPLVEGRKRTELLFTNRNGDPVKHQPFYREHWSKACTSNIAAPRPRIHDLRHSHVAWLIAAGVGLPVIQARLGHEKITTTIDTYGHLIPDLHVQAADAASRVFTSARPHLVLVKRDP